MNLTYSQKKTVDALMKLAWHSGTFEVRHNVDISFNLRPDNLIVTMKRGEKFVRRMMTYSVLTDARYSPVETLTLMKEGLEQ